MPMVCMVPVLMHWLHNTRHTQHIQQHRLFCEVMITCWLVIFVPAAASLRKSKTCWSFYPAGEPSTSEFPRGFSFNLYNQTSVWIPSTHNHHPWVFPAESARFCPLGKGTKCSAMMKGFALRKVKFYVSKIKTLPLNWLIFSFCVMNLFHNWIVIMWVKNSFCSWYGMVSMT